MGIETIVTCDKCKAVCSNDAITNHLKIPVTKGRQFSSYKGVNYTAIWCNDCIQDKNMTYYPDPDQKEEPSCDVGDIITDLMEELGFVRE